MKKIVIVSIVSEDFYAIKGNLNPHCFSASQCRKLRSTVGTDFYDFITLKKINNYEKS